MTTEQAAHIVKLLLAAFPTQVVEKPTLALYRDHLKALPWREGRTAAAIYGLIATRTEPHLPAIGVVMSAAGVAPEAAHLLVEAMTTGRELVADLSTRTGWAVGEAAIPIPVGSSDEAPSRALNPGVGARAEPPEPMPEACFSDEQRRENLRRLGGLFRDLGRKGQAS